jgi:Family of unknown function (DUF6282)
MSYSPEQTESLSRSLLQGAVDLHIHTAPDIFPRSVDAIEAAQDAKAAGMAAIAIKSHSTDTAARAETASKVAGFPVTGGVALNYPVGGLNPYAVEESARQGGRIVWLPTLGARHFLCHSANVPILAEKSPKGSDGLVVTTADGSVTSEVDEILQIVKDNDMILASGHVEPSEALTVFRRARELGITRLVVTHPHAAFIGASADDMRELAGLGAMNEMHYAFVTQVIVPPQTFSYIAGMIRAAGVEACFLATDGGQAVNPRPAEALRLFVVGMLNEGFTEDEVRFMVADAPRKLLLG